MSISSTRQRKYNIAVLIDDTRAFRYCPVFDNGGSLLSDTAMDYPLNTDLAQMIDTAAPKTFSSDFDEQLDIAEELYGQTLHFTYTEKDIQKLLEQEIYYPEEIKQRVYGILMIQKRKYQYLFRK